MGNYGLSCAVADFFTSLLRQLPAELSHDIGIKFLEHQLQRFIPRPDFHSSIDLSMQIDGWPRLDHPLGLAAGFDKNAVAVESFFDLGFSFVEVGTVTPRPQAGNPKPRLFRQVDHLGIINRMGFNNDGIEAMCQRIKRNSPLSGKQVLGINVGKNKDTSADQAVTDYVSCLKRSKDLGSYYVINISSPNTPGLRDLATKSFLRTLGGEIGQIDSDTKEETRKLMKKVWVKVDPDMDKNTFKQVIEGLCEEGFAGVILTNTHRVELPQAGGQSGSPLGVISSRSLEWANEVHQGSLPMIGVGGVLSGGDVFQKVIRGASLVQLYTAFVYRGPLAVIKILKELEWELKLRGFSSLKQAYRSHYNL